jgi:DNA-binding CsgD family transcriptional regulator
MMPDERFPDLTDSQKACLLMVSIGATSKEIGPQIGLTFRTVDQYIHGAQHLMGVATRREAARALLATIDSGELKRLQLKFPAIAHIAQNPSSTVPEQTPVQRQTFVSEATEGRSWTLRKLVRSELAPPPMGGGTHDLTATQRISEMFKAAGYLAAVTMGLILFLAGALKLLS